MEVEIWKDVCKDGYEGLYQISNLGRVKCLEKIVVRRNISNKKKETQEYLFKEKVMSPGLVNGYLIINLQNKKKIKYTSVHRLVAIAFIDNPQNKKYINHKDGNPLNNNVLNLEWCTQKENMEHAVRIGLIKTGKDHVCSKLIGQYKSGVLIKIWGSVSDIKRQLGFHKGHISDCALGKTNSSMGFQWKYINK